MKFTWLITLVALLATACQKVLDEELTPVQAQIELSFIAQDDTESKAQTPLLSQTEDNNLDQVIVYIVNTQSGVVEQIKQLLTPDNVVNSVTLTSPVGVKDIYVVGNPNVGDLSALLSVVSIADLKSIFFDLQNEQEGSFFMVGKKLSVTVSQNQPNNIQLSLCRSAARIHLTNVTAQFSAHLAGKTLAIDSIYLLRSIGKKSYGDSTYVFAPEKIYNRVVGGFQFQNYDLFSPPIIIAPGQTFAAARPNGTHYYTYSNAATTFAQATKLIIAATVNGVRTYYPIAINIAGNGYMPTSHVGVRANYDYKVSVVIKGIGSANPNTPVTGSYCSVTLIPKIWSIFNEQVIYQ